MSAQLWLEKQKQMKRFTVYKRGGGSRRDPSVVAETEEQGACDLTPPYTPSETSPEARFPRPAVALGCSGKYVELGIAQWHKLKGEFLLLKGETVKSGL